MTICDYLESIAAFYFDFYVNLQCIYTNIRNSFVVFVSLPMMDRCVEASTSALPVFLISDSGDLKYESIKLGLAPF